MKNHKKKRTVPVWKIVLAVFMALAEIFLIFSIYVNSKLDLVNKVSSDSSDFDWSTLTNKDVMKDEDVSNILLIGQDQRSTDSNGNSDTMIIASINKKTNAITLVSLMRDMYVTIPGHGQAKINASYAEGGMELLDATIEQNFGVHIDGNVEVNFDGFMKALNVVGNIDVSLTQEEADFLNETMSRNLYDDSGKVWHLKAGVNSMTSEQALAYARDRYTGNADWDRTKRQRKVILAVYDKLKNEKLGAIMKAANSILPCLTTDMGNSELLGYAYLAASNKMTLDSDHHLPVDGDYSNEVINGQDVLAIDTAANAAAIQNWLYGSGSEE